MYSHVPRILFVFFMSIAAMLVSSRSAMAADSPAQLESDARAALANLYAESPTAKSLGERAKGILIFPKIVKAGLIIGGQGGNGVLLKGGQVAGHYSTGAVSIGLQAGGQSYGYALFFMSDPVMQQFEQSSGWEIGVGPSIVIVDSGAAKNITNLTAKSDIYAFIFGQKGLMAGMGLQGSKITKTKD